MDLIDTSEGGWGGRWIVQRPKHASTVLTAGSAEIAGGALVFRAVNGTLLLALAPGEWLTVQRSVGVEGELPEGAQVFERSR